MSETVPCVACGTPTPREEMFGYGEELRCPTCSQALRKRLDPGVLRRTAPDRPPVVTIALAAAAVITTLLYGSGEPPAWILWLTPTGGIRAGETWRLVTSTLLHGGTIHLVFNVWWLWDFGRAIESRWGHVALAGLWLGLGLATSAVQWFAAGPSIGLSGVVYGLWGMLFALRKTKDVAARAANPQVNQIFIFWFFLCIVLGWNIGNWAHGSGAVFGYALGRAIDAPPRRRLVLVSLLAALALAVGALTALVDPPWAW